MSNFAPAVEAATKIISFLSESDMEVGISEISRGTELNKNIVFRTLNSLEKEGWIYCNDQKYSLTLLPFKLASRAVSRVSLNTVALPVLYELHNATGESTYLGVLKKDKVMYIQHLDGVRDVRVAGRVGGEYDLYCSAPGKILLAYADEAFIKNYIEQYMGGVLEPRTQFTITDPDLLLEELAWIREKQYATDREEFGNGISCVAAPVFDYTGNVVGCVGNSAFTINHDSESVIRRLLPEVTKAAEQISIRLGGIQ